MSQFFIEYGLFLLKAGTIVAAVVVVIFVAASAGRKANQEGLEVEKHQQEVQVSRKRLRQGGPEQGSAKERSQGGKETRQGRGERSIEPAAQFRHKFQR